MNVTKISRLVLGRIKCSHCEHRVAFGVKNGGGSTWKCARENLKIPEGNVYNEPPEWCPLLISENVLRRLKGE